jgi:WD40 repeat protein
MTVLIKNMEGITPIGERLPLVDKQAARYSVQRGVYVSDIALSPDGKYVALSSAMMEYEPSYYKQQTTPDVLVWSIDRVKFWQTAYRYLLSERLYWTGPDTDVVLRGNTAPVRQIAYNADGSLLASAGLDGTVRLWHMPEGTAYAVLRGHRAAVWDVDFSPDGARLVSAGGDGTLRLWDVRTEESLWTVPLGMTIEVVSFSPDGSRIAAAGQDGSLWLLNAETGELLDSRQAPTSMWSVAFSPDGKMLATGDVDNQVVVWDVIPETPTAVQRQVLRGHTGPVYDTVFSPNGELIASASSDHTVRLWDAQTGTEIALLEDHTASVYGVAFSPDGRLLASGSWDRTARLWDVETGELLRVLDSDYPVDSVAFSPDGQFLAYGATYLWDIVNAAPANQWDHYWRGWGDSYISRISKLVFSDDGQMLISGGYFGTFVWNVDGQDEPRRINASPAIDLYGDLLAINGLGLYDLINDQWLTDLNDDNPALTTQLTRDIAFSPDGTLIVTGGTDSKLRFWGVSDSPAPTTEAE